MGSEIIIPSYLIIQSTSSFLEKSKPFYDEVDSTKDLD